MLPACCLRALLAHPHTCAACTHAPSGELTTRGSLFEHTERERSSLLEGSVSVARTPGQLHHLAAARRAPEGPEPECSEQWLLDGADEELPSFYWKAAKTFSSMLRTPKMLFACLRSLATLRDGSSTATPHPNPGDHEMD